MRCVGRRTAVSLLNITQTCLQGFRAKNETRRTQKGTNFSTGFLCQDENQKEKGRNKLLYRFFVPRENPEGERKDQTFLQAFCAKQKKNTHGSQNPGGKHSDAWPAGCHWGFRLSLVTVPRQSNMATAVAHGCSAELLAGQTKELQQNVFLFVF